MSSSEISGQQNESNDASVENNAAHEKEELEKLGICKAQTSESIERKIEQLVEEQTQQEDELFHNNGKRIINKNIELNTEIQLEEKEQSIKIKDDHDIPVTSGHDSFNSLLTPNEYKLQESLLEKNIRTGEVTPFGNELGRNSSKLNPELSAFEKYLKTQVEMTKAKQKKKISEKPSSLPSTSYHKEKDIIRKFKTCSDPTTNLSSWKELPEIIKDDEESEYLPSESDSSFDENKTSKKRKYTNKKSNLKLKSQRNQTKRENKESDESDWNSSGDEKKLRRRQKRSADIRVLDDGNIADYDMRIKMWNETKDTEIKEFHEIEGGYHIANSLWTKLFKYQKVGVQWLWELHQQRCGGILGDEMGLGKTIQIICFLAGLSSSNIRTKHSLYRGLGPSLIICPTTVMHQWVREFHTWWPNFRVAILHDSGAFEGKRTDLIKQLFKNRNSSSGPILITSYNGTFKHREILLQYDWHYVILDEGHKIRNPDAKITLNVKQFRTPHRLIVTGSPMQNNLKELWSLMDFVFPGKLATLPVFTAELAVPIIQGGYTNATQFQVATAYKCALILKDTISPYLLRRNKSDVKSHINLTEKNEQVLFCRLTPHQTQLYKEYLNATPVLQILQGRGLPFVALNTLRKICNHPDLYSGGTKIFKDTVIEEMPIEERFGFWEKSCKMVVIDALLKIWKRQGHRVLLFTQGVKILRILENYLKSRNYSYLTLAGTTAISQRQPLINKFNEDPNIFVFLLTTRVGGLGVNLTGANRVVIFDPDWNPATDCQAKERAWRIGQCKDVTIYRLITAGTIEEKMYHRQIFKQFLSNKVLKDPRQRRFFKSNDLFELFTLKEYEDEASTETGAIFAGTSSEIRIKDKIKEKYRKPIAPNVSKKIEFSNEKLNQMRLLAQNISLQIANKTISPNDIPKDKNLKTIADKTSKDKKRKRKWKSFEGEEIPLLVKKKSKKMDEEEESIQRPKEKDDYVLRKLFKKTGLQTALRHDVIIHGVGEGGDADLDIVEGEAKRVAKEAIEALKESSRNECWQAQTGRVTWTGNNGNIRRRKTSSTITSEQTNNENKSNDYISEDQLLEIIQKRNMLLVQPNSKFRPPKPSHLQLLTDIRNFLTQGGGGGSATTKEVIDEFSSRLPPTETPLFKCLLEEICTFTRTTSGEGLWTLRDNLEGET